MAVNLVDVSSRLRAFWREIEEQDGEITEEQEERLVAFLAEEQGLCEMADKLDELEESRQALERWVASARAKVGRWKGLEKTIRTEMKPRVTKILEDTGESVIRWTRGSIGLRANYEGTLELEDSGLVKEHTVRGYTEKEVEDSTIGREYFEAQVVYRLKRDALKAKLRLLEQAPTLKRPVTLGKTHLSHEPALSIRTLRGKGGKVAVDDEA